ncbi:MAG TPA: inositol monophosphatase family protein [Alphaproteobacteria bacterium]|nr:inositol monophosphatase family protein [Alphaproteobacteria bacterium]
MRRARRMEPTSARSALFNVMDRAVRKAARSLVHDFGEVEQLQVSIKGPGDFVSAADHQAERILKSELSRARPDFGFLMEEGGEEKGRDPHHRWVIDPLDGTTNFLHGIPQFCVSVALERDGDPIAGVVYDPLRDEFFYGERGVGAFMNDRRLRVSSRSQLGDSVIGTGIPFRARGDHPRYLRMLESVMGSTAGVRRMGAAALDLAYVAAGRFDGFFELGLSRWDMAAGIVIVREAGGFVSEIDGGRNPLASGSILAANDRLRGPLAELLQKADREQNLKTASSG